MGEFGKFFKQKRMGLGKTLRQFCQENKLDPGNISKIERGRLAPPGSEEKLKDYARYLGIAFGTAEWKQFKDLAAIDAGKIPEDLRSEKVLARLPIFFRALRDKKFSDKDLKTLIEKIRKS